MVWGAVSKKGRLPLKFVEKGIKIDTEYYLQEIMEGHVLKYAPKLFQEPWVYQQDSAPAHASKKTQTWCEGNLPNFIAKDLWPPASPNLIHWITVYGALCRHP